MHQFMMHLHVFILWWNYTVWMALNRCGWLFVDTFCHPHLSLKPFWRFVGFIINWNGKRLYFYQLKGIVYIWQLIRKEPLWIEWIRVHPGYTDIREPNQPEWSNAAKCNSIHATNSKNTIHPIGNRFKYSRIFTRNQSKCIKHYLTFEGC